MSLAGRLARAGVRAAARRWPVELAELMRDEWLAELAAVDGSCRKLTFAGSLVVSPAVDEPSWPERASAVGRATAVAAGVTLLAAFATNLARGSDLFAPAVIVFAAVALCVVGVRVRSSIALMGAALFAFLLAGNPVPIMPFMGAADIAPAVVVWAAGLAVVARVTRRLAADGHRRRAALAGVGGGLVALDLAVAAGSAHAAAVLSVPAWTAPAWFPLALLPGGTVPFGPEFADGSAVFGRLQAAGPAFHASDILLANAAVMAGPLLLCAAFVLAGTLRRSELSATHRPGRAEARSGQATSRIQLGAGLMAALGALTAGPLLPASGGDANVVLRQMLDNSTAFGFGFVEHPAGLGAVALLAALLAMRLIPAARPAA